MAWTMKIVSRYLPKRQSREYRTGAQSQGIFQRSEFYKVFENKISKDQNDFNPKQKFAAKFNLGL